MGDLIQHVLADVGIGDPVHERLDLRVIGRPHRIEMPGAAGRGVGAQIVDRFRHARAQLRERQAGGCALPHRVLLEIEPGELVSRIVMLVTALQDHRPSPSYAVGEDACATRPRLGCGCDLGSYTADELRGNAGH